MVVAGARHLVHVTLHLQLTVQNDAQVTNKTGRVNSGTGNGELKVWWRNFGEWGTGTKPNEFRFRRIQPNSEKPAVCMV